MQADNHGNSGFGLFWKHTDAEGLQRRKAAEDKTPGEHPGTLHQESRPQCSLGAALMGLLAHLTRDSYS